MATSISPKPASGRGDLDGFEVRCDCGLVWGVSLPSLARSEAHAHEAWHARAGR